METTGFWFFGVFLNINWTESFKSGNVSQQWLPLSQSPPVFFWGAVDSALLSPRQGWNHNQDFNPAFPLLQKSQIFFLVAI